MYASTERRKQTDERNDLNVCKYREEEDSTSKIVYASEREESHKQEKNRQIRREVCMNASE